MYLCTIKHNNNNLNTTAMINVNELIGKKCHIYNTWHGLTSFIIEDVIIYNDGIELSGHTYEWGINDAESYKFNDLATLVQAYGRHGGVQVDEYTIEGCTIYTNVGIEK